MILRRILFVASEAHPFMKTGGLGDVCGSLPQSLRTLGEDVRLLLPAYREARARADHLKPVAELKLPGLTEPVRLLDTVLPGTQIRTWLVDHTPSFDRPGNPYQDPTGQDWPDNALRFALLAQAALAICAGVPRLRWRPELVHGHDWQAGLVPALLSLQHPRPATVFTIHNLAYQGLFPYETFSLLNLPPEMWNFSALEFHGQLSFIKGGIGFADRITTVSPTYASEIQTPEFGFGLDGLLKYRSPVLRGILNGIDVRTWNPARDHYLVTPYGPSRAKTGKAANKAQLQARMGLASDPALPLIGMVSRQVEQKGIDLVIESIPILIERGVQFAILGSGERRFERALNDLAKQYPAAVSVVSGYDEALAHQIVAGADLFLVPSRFEPCGLTQLYSLRYGTVPVVRSTGGLRDSVINATPDSLADGTATGVVFEPAHSAALVHAVDRAIELYRQPRVWSALRRAGMAQDFSWPTRAREYQRLYDELVPRSAPA